MKKEYYLYLGVLLLVIVGLAFAFVYKNKIPQTIDKPILGQQVTFYYGNGCPHCANVEKYISDNKIDEKLKIDRKEVFYDQTNAAEMSAKAQQCSLDQSKLGVPLLWTGTRCITGDTPIIDYFSSLVK